MKLLLVCVSALVLVALGDVIPSNGWDSVYGNKPEGFAGYAVLGRVGSPQEPQGTFAEELADGK